MKAVVRSRYGPPEMLQLVDVAKPAPRAGEVRVRVLATALNASDHELLTGKPLYGRIAGPFRPRVRVLGSDLAGVVDAVGAGVTELAVGDEVFGDAFDTFGGFAQWACIPVEKLSTKPAALSFEQAAAIPQSGLIAWQGLTNDPPLRAGQRLLINGAGGGGGSFAVQIGKHLGAHVTGVDSAEKLDTIRSLGADRAVDYARQDVTAEDHTYDRILDLVGHHSIWAYRRILAPGGRYLLVGGPMRYVFGALIWGSLISLFGRRKMGLLFHFPNRGMDELSALVARGTITPPIDRVFPLSETAAALRYLGDGHAKGKVVISQGN